MELKDYFKEIYQFQFSFVEEDRKEQKNNLNYLVLRENEMFNSDENYTIEIYPQILFCKEDVLNPVFSRISKMVYNKSKCTHLQLLVKEKSGHFEAGSYWVNYPKAFSTGCYEKELSTFFDSDTYALLLICADIYKLCILGRNGFAEALKQTGEIRQVIRNHCEEKMEIYDSVNVNALAHAAGININKLMVMDVIAFKE